MIPITDTKKIGIRRAIKGAQRGIDIRWFVKYGGVEGFHRIAKGLYMDELPFKREVLPVLADLFGYVLVDKMVQNQKEPKEST